MDNKKEVSFWDERVDLAAAFRWTARLNMHESIANHFSLSVSEDGTRFLVNPNQSHFSQIRASDILLLDANDPETMNQPNAPDSSAWGLHGSIHRLCPHIRCALHVHPTFSTTLASLKDSNLPPIDQNAAAFYGRVVIDEHFGGIALQSEGERCASLLKNPKIQIMIMGNHGILAFGNTVCEAFTRLYYFERAAENYIRALQTQKPLRKISNIIAKKVADDLDQYYRNYKYLDALKLILDKEESDYAK